MLQPWLSGQLVCQSSTSHSYPTTEGHRNLDNRKLRCLLMVGYEWMVEDWQTKWPGRRGSNTMYIYIYIYFVLFCKFFKIYSFDPWIALLHSIFDVLTINGNLHWKRGRIDLKSNRLNSFLVNNSSLRNVKNPMYICYSSSIRWESMPIFDFKSTRTANSKWYLINNKGINILIFQMTG